MKSPAVFKSFLGAGALVFGSTLLMNFCGYVYNAIAGRTLGVADYGSLYALTSLYTMAILPAALTSPVISKLAAERHAEGDREGVKSLFVYVCRGFALLGIAIFLLSIAVSVPVASFVQLPAWMIVIVGAMTAVALFSAAVRAFSQGIHEYGIYSASASGEGVARVVSVAIAATFGLSVGAGAWSFFAGLTSGALIAAIPLAFKDAAVRVGSVRFDWAKTRGTVFAAGSLAVGMSCIGFADVVIVKHFFASVDAGLYSAASLCAKMLFYLLSFVPVVLIPQATHRHTRGEGTRATLWIPFFFVIAATAIFVLAFTWFGTTVLDLVVGSRFAAAAALLPTYAAAMGLLSLTNTMGSYGLATNRQAFSGPLLVATLATLAGVAAFHPSTIMVARELFFGTCVMTLATAIPLSLQARLR